MKESRLLTALQCPQFKKLSRFSTRVLIAAISATLSLMGTGCLIQGGHTDKKTTSLPAIYDFRQKMGAAAHSLLSGDFFTDLVVEIQPVGEFAPATESITHLQVFLNEHLNKPGGITFQINPPVAATGKTSFSIEEVRALESKNRKIYSKDKRLSVFILFVDGNSVRDEEKQKLLGHAHLSTSIVIYEKTIRDIMALAGQPPQPVLETAILEHEFSHLLGLVGNGSSEQSQHRDPDHRYHCNNPECLMHFALGTGEAGPALLAVPKLDQACEDDLKANGGKGVSFPPAPSSMPSLAP